MHAGRRIEMGALLVLHACTGHWSVCLLQQRPQSIDDCCSFRERARRILCFTLTRCYTMHHCQQQEHISSTAACIPVCMHACVALLPMFVCPCRCAAQCCCCAGDSRAVLSRGGHAIQLTDDQKADRPDEVVSMGLACSWRMNAECFICSCKCTTGVDFCQDARMVHRPLCCLALPC